MRNLLFVGCFFVVVSNCLFIGCKKDRTSAGAQNTTVDSAYIYDTIPADLEAFLDTVTQVNADNGNLVLSDGMTVDSLLKT